MLVFLMYFSNFFIGFPEGSKIPLAIKNASNQTIIELNVSLSFAHFGNFYLLFIGIEIN
jgi:hypothetical protein